MTTEVKEIVASDHVEGEAEHVFWLRDIEKWRADHRCLLGLLAQAQGAVLEQDAALDGRIKEIHLHEMMRLRHELLTAGAEGEAPEGEADLLKVHREMEAKHAHAREVQERMRVHHERLAQLVEELVQATNEAM